MVGEVEAVRYLLDRQLRLLQKQPSLTIYHLENKIRHHLARQALDHQRQVVGRDVQLIGTTRNLMLGLVMISSSGIAAKGILLDVPPFL
nr:hypothetical protein [Pontibacter amylolyticus]